VILFVTATIDCENGLQARQNQFGFAEGACDNAAKMIIFFIIHPQNSDLLRYDAQTFEQEQLNHSLHCGESM
jgi:hypothetical protein